MIVMNKASFCFRFSSRFSVSAFVVACLAFSHTACWGTDQKEELDPNSSYLTGEIEKDKKKNITITFYGENRSTVYPVKLISGNKLDYVTIREIFDYTFGEDNRPKNAYDKALSLNKRINSPNTSPMFYHIKNGNSKNPEEIGGDTEINNFDPNDSIDTRILFNGKEQTQIKWEAAVVTEDASHTQSRTGKSYVDVGSDWETIKKELEKSLDDYTIHFSNVSIEAHNQTTSSNQLNNFTTSPGTAEISGLSLRL